MKCCVSNSKNAAGGLNRPEGDLEGREWRIKKELASEGMELEDQKLWDVARGSSMMNTEIGHRRMVRPLVHQMRNGTILAASRDMGVGRI